MADAKTAGGFETRAGPFRVGDKHKAYRGFATAWKLPNGTDVILVAPTADDALAVGAFLSDSDPHLPAQAVALIADGALFTSAGEKHHGS